MQPVNDLIFKELMMRGYSLEGNTRIWDISDSKLWYLTPEQAQSYLDLENSSDYSDKMFDTEIKMLKEVMPKISEDVLHGDAINIIDIGCGDGKKAVPVIDELFNKAEVRYCPIDISSYMVKKAIEKIKGLNKGEVVDFMWNISDFDNLENISALLRNGKFRQNVLLFLGSTIGNFEFHEVMYEIEEAMSSMGDSLLLGVALESQTPDEIVKSYGADSKEDNLVDNFLSKVITQLGFEKDEVTFGVRYRNSRIEIYYTVNKDKTIEFQGKSTEFKKGDQILVAVSYRYTPENLEEMLKLYFKDVKFHFNKDKSWALILCKK